MDKRYGISWGGVLTNLADPVKLVYGIIIEAPGNFFRNIRIGAGDRHQLGFGMIFGVGIFVKGEMSLQS